jgi:hypothetical protein
MEQLKNNTFSAVYKNLLEKNSILVYFLIVILVPFVLLSFSNQPATDDYYFVNLIQKFGIKDANIWLYQNWGGRYIANGILNFCPLYFSQLYWYKIIPILLIFLWVYATYFLIKLVVPSFSNKEKATITATILLLFLALSEEITSAFYWIVGGITHFLPVSFLLISVGLYLKYLKLNKLIYFLGSAFFIALAMVCNENITITIGIICTFNTKFFVNKKIIVCFSCLELPYYLDVLNFLRQEILFELAPFLSKSTLYRLYQKE